MSDVGMEVLRQIVDEPDPVMRQRQPGNTPAAEQMRPVSRVFSLIEARIDGALMSHRYLLFLLAAMALASCFWRVSYALRCSASHQ
jgi:hypothetical protein